MDRSAEKEQKKNRVHSAVKEKTQGRGEELNVEKKKAAKETHKEFVRSGNGFYMRLYIKICLANLNFVLVESI